MSSVIVNKRTNRIVDGHLRVEMASDKGEQVPVDYVDLSEEEENLILTTLDPIATLAIADDAKLRALLETLDAPRNTHKKTNSGTILHHRGTDGAQTDTKST